MLSKPHRHTQMLGLYVSLGGGLAKKMTPINCGFLIRASASMYFNYTITNLLLTCIRKALLGCDTIDLLRVQE